MPNLKHSEWDPLSNGVFRVTIDKNSYLALSRPKAVSMLSNEIIKIAKEKDGYVFLKEPTTASVALFASEEFACSANPSLTIGEVSKLRVKARKCAEKKYDHLGKFLEPPAPNHIVLTEPSLAP